MMISLFLATVVTLTLFVVGQAIPEGYIQYENGCAWSPSSNHKSVEYIRDYTSLPQNYMNSNDLPSSFSWDNIDNGNSLVTTVFNQFEPNACGSCWAVSGVGALSDRIKIDYYKNNNNKFMTDINLSSQYLLDCCMQGSNNNNNIECGSCNGGSTELAYQLISQTGISDTSCSPYLGYEPSHWGEVSCTNYQCRTCNRFGDCYYVKPKIEYMIDEFGSINYLNLSKSSNMTMEQSMRSEIYERGPISCLMYAHSEKFENYNGTTGYQDGVIVDNVKYNGTTHFVTLIGWGQTNDGLNYWVGRNSFGTIWGQNGFFKAQRGVNIYNMEQNCYWATIKY